MTKQEDKNTTTESTVTEERLFIGGLDKGISDNDIRQRLSPYGKTLSIERVNKEEKDYLFVYVNFRAKTPLDLQKCLSTLNMLTWRGKRLRVEKARPNIMDTYRKDWEENKRQERSFHRSPFYKYRKSHLKKKFTKPYK